jgi:hypothetical protein
MPKYIVKGTTIKHGKKGQKPHEHKEYPEGSEIELTEAEAKPIMHHLAPAEKKEGKK